MTDHLTGVGRRSNPWWPQGGIGGSLSCTSPGPAASVWQAVVLKQIAKRIQRAAPLSDCTSAEQALERSGGLPTAFKGILGTDSNSQFPFFNISNVVHPIATIMIKYTLNSLEIWFKWSTAGLPRRQYGKFYMAQGCRAVWSDIICSLQQCLHREQSIIGAGTCWYMRRPVTLPRIAIHHRRKDVLPDKRARC